MTDVIVDQSLIATETKAEERDGEKAVLRLACSIIKNVSDDQLRQLVDGLDDPSSIERIKKHQKLDTKDSCDVIRGWIEYVLAAAADEYLCIE